MNVFGQVTYTLTATNNGPAAMPNAVVTDDIQAHLELVSVNPSGPTCGSPAPPTRAAPSAATSARSRRASRRRSRSSSAPNRGHLLEPRQGRPDSTPGGPIDIDLTNNTSETVTFLANAADLSIAKAASPDVVGVGQTLTYTMVVTNNGPGDASGVKVRDSLPTVLSFATVTTTTGTCTGTQNITCDIGSLANGATAAIRFARLRPRRHGLEHRKRHLDEQRPERRQQLRQRHQPRDRRRPRDHEGREPVAVALGFGSRTRSRSRTSGRTPRPE